MVCSLLKEAEDENMQRVIWAKCSVQTGVFQGTVVSDTLYTTRLKKEEHGSSPSSQCRGDC